MTWGNPSAWRTVLTVRLVRQEHPKWSCWGGHFLRFYPPPPTHTSHCHHTCVFKHLHRSQAVFCVYYACHYHGGLLTFTHDIFLFWNVLSLPMESAVPAVDYSRSSLTWSVLLLFPDETNFLQVRSHMTYFMSFPQLISRHMCIEMYSNFQWLSRINKKVTNIWASTTLDK